MAESLSEPSSRRAPEGPRPLQGSVTSHGTLAVYEPGSGRLVGEVRVTSPAQVREATAAARAAQKDWAARSIKDRGQVLRRFEQLVLDRADEIAVIHLDRSEVLGAAKEPVFLAMMEAGDVPEHEPFYFP